MATAVRRALRGRLCVEFALLAQQPPGLVADEAWLKPLWTEPLAHHSLLRNQVLRARGVHRDHLASVAEVERLVLDLGAPAVVEEVEWEPVVREVGLDDVGVVLLRRRAILKISWARVPHRLGKR